MKWIKIKKETAEEYMSPHQRWREKKDSEISKIVESTTSSVEQFRTE